jgi:hypothetical protein
MLLDDKTISVKGDDDIVYVGKGVFFHRVINSTNDEMVFETISPGRITRPVLSRETALPSSSPSSLRTF